MKTTSNTASNKAFRGKIPFPGGDAIPNRLILGQFAPASFKSQRDTFTKKWILLILVGWFLATGFNSQAAVQWLTDKNAALARARAENKIVLLDFTGSDWCGWCKRLKSEVFDNPTFAQYAHDHLIMVEVDFPQLKYQSTQERAANMLLAQHYGIRGYPTIIVLNPDGAKIGKLGYVPGGPDSFIAHLEHETGQSPAPAKTVAPPAPIVAKPQPAPAPQKVANTFPELQPGDIILKGVSGSKGRLMALINNESMLAGETANVKVKAGRVEITCNEVREDSASITVAGLKCEIKLAQH